MVRDDREERTYGCDLLLDYIFEISVSLLEEKLE